MSAYEDVKAGFVRDHIGKMAIVDVRPENMYVTGHIPGAVNIRWDVAHETSDPASTLVDMFSDNGLTADSEIIVYCQGHGHAQLACEALAGKGFEHLYCYAGGMDDWRKDPANPVEEVKEGF